MDDFNKLDDFIQYLARKLESANVYFDAPAEKIIRYLLTDKYNGAKWPFSQELIALIEGDLDKLCDGQPLEYVTGIRHFFGYIFRVSPAVLIPRWETEELVDYAIKTVPQGSHVVDIGTGSGCIAISFQLHRKDCHVSAIDISQPALKIATENNHLLDANVCFYEADLRKESTLDILKKFDVWLSNPPYIDPARELIDPKIRFEPALALYGPANNVLFYYQRLAALAIESALSPLLLIIELNEFYADAIMNIFEGAYSKKIMHDINGTKRILEVRYV